MHKLFLSVNILLCLLLTGCQLKSTSSRYTMANDIPPQRAPKTSEMKDAEPTNEKPSRGGNKDYTVWGKDYKVLSSAKGYSAQGIASYYGQKFHGHKTSNGEVYDMYGMSAAHKSLPLPSFVEVTNLSNGKKAVVRVNDRGPFHKGRIIDLSYSAAYKLGFADKGTANVSVRVLERFTPKYIHIKANQAEDEIKNTAQTFSLLHQLQAKIIANNTSYDLIIGPISDQTQYEELLADLAVDGYLVKPYQNSK